MSCLVCFTGEKENNSRNQLLFFHVFGTNSRAWRTLSAGGQHPTVTVAPASASFFAIAHP
jgi:hypothetical protein